jgi:hypothetical protein
MSNDYIKVNDGDDSEVIIANSKQMLEDVNDSIDNLENINVGGSSASSVNSIKDIMRAILERQKAIFKLFSEDEDYS